jgi:glycosyltransferase involved in cell wall biosynthesis
MTLNVAAYTSGQNTPSARFRVRQYIQQLSLLGVTVNEKIPNFEIGSPKIRLPEGVRARDYPRCWPKLALSIAKSITARLSDINGINQSDLVWLERGFVPGILSLEPLIKKPIVYDVDDSVWSIWPFGEKQVAYIASKSSVILAGNEYIASRLEKYNKNIEIIPTAVDGRYFSPAYVVDESFFTIGWTGTSGNFQYLYAIEPALKSILLISKNIKLKIVAERPPVFRSLPYSQVEFVQWRPEIEASVLNSFSVGIMPLIDSEWARGKCAFKIIQYMASGLPVVSSPVGANLDLPNYLDYGYYAKSTDQWSESILSLFESRADCLTRSRNSREVFEKNFESHIVAKKIAAIFKGAVS